MQQQISVPTKPERKFIPNNIDFSKWEHVEPYYSQLLNRTIEDTESLKIWLKDWSELDAAMGENSRWVYVRTTTDTSDEQAKAALVNLYANIYPHSSVLANQLEKKFIACEFTSELDASLFETTLRKIRKSIEIFRDENIPLESEMSLLQNQYNNTIGAQSIFHNQTEMTLQQAAMFLRDNNRALRQEVFEKVSNRRVQDSEKLDELLTQLIKLRNQIALNAGFANYRDFRFAQLGRFDYTPEDCYRFHQSVQEAVVPVLIENRKLRKSKLNVSELKPWDTDVEVSGKPPLKPFNKANELVEKTVACFEKLDPYFANCIAVMNKMNYLDLESRMHKGPGGYNMSMPEIGVPFIFMNSTNSELDVVTMVHEGGHAVHSFLSHPLDLTAFKDTTPEIAEVASMGMELMSMEYWEVFYPNKEDLKRAKKNHLNHIISILGRTCMGDAFQHWMYLNPEHTVAERRNKWMELNKQYVGDVVDWSGYEEAFATSYQSILHFYEVPFYYIEYAFAQLGALGLWSNFKKDKAASIEAYKAALQLGYTKSIPVFYETAGTKFAFDKHHIEQLMVLLKDELSKLEN